MWISLLCVAIVIACIAGIAGCCVLVLVGIYTDATPFAPLGIMGAILCCYGVYRWTVWAFFPPEWLTPQSATFGLQVAALCLGYGIGFVSIVNAIQEESILHRNASFLIGATIVVCCLCFSANLRESLRRAPAPAPAPAERQ